MLYGRLLLLLCWFFLHKTQGAGNSQLEELILPYGYPMEYYMVTTEDKFNLALYRIPHGREEKGTLAGRQRPVVYLQHGLLDTSAAFLMNGPSGSLGFILADNGFDVWLGNCRGNTFSNFTLQRNMDRDTFWDFSRDELVQYDMPALLQYVLDRTGVAKMMYVGHCQGTAVAHALFSERHPLADRISMAFMLSPSAFVKHITSDFIRTMALFRVDRFGAKVGYHQAGPVSAHLHTFAGPFCNGTGPVCADLISILYGYNPDNLDPARWGTYLAYTPAGASVKLMTHWAQGVRAWNDTRFQMFDYGTQCRDWMLFKRKRCNQDVYHQRRPYEYDLRKIQVPLVFYYGAHDTLSDLIDVLALKKSLSAGVLVEDHLELDYTHVDFIWGMDAPYRIYSKILQTMFAKLQEENPELVSTQI